MSEFKGMWWWSVVLCCVLSVSCGKGEQAPIYHDASYSVEMRVADLLGRMTLEEKLGQMNIPCVYKPELGGLRPDQADAARLFSEGTVFEEIPNYKAKYDACRKFTEGSLFESLGPGGGFFTMANTIIPGGARKQAEFFNELQRIALEKTRLGIPLLQVEEGTHGLMCSESIVFPEGLALGSSWNMPMLQQVYAVAAKEGRSRGQHALCTLVIEPNRDPRLGRNCEAYSEDTYLTGRVAESIVKGIQGDGIHLPDKAIAVLCHYPGQSEPVSGLEFGPMLMSERSIRQVFLPPWERGIKQFGALGVMATHPSLDALDGMPAHASRRFLTDVLRSELNFRGLVLGEGNSVRTILWKNVAETQKEAGQLALNAGLDVSISLEPGYMQDMIESVEDGTVSMALIDTAVSRTLRMKFELGLFESPFVEIDNAVKNARQEASQQLALQAAREGIVLLKNEGNLLPLDKNLRSIAVIGPNANTGMNQLGDYIPRTLLQHIVTPLDGIRATVSPRTEVTYVEGCKLLGEELNQIEAARRAASNAEVAVVVVGESKETCSEKSDAATLELTGLQQQLVEAVYATGTPTVVVLINGRPLATQWIAEHVPAVVEAWYCGEQGGNAIADVLFGEHNPGGRLAITIPRHVGQLPVYYNYTPSKAMRQRQGYVDLDASPLYPFGYGLSYTTFEYSNLRIEPASIQSTGTVNVTVDVKNTGDVAGDEVVQLYINDVISSTTTAVRELRGFEKVNLQPGKSQTVTMTLMPEHLQMLDRDLNWVVEPGTFEVMVGKSCEDIQLRGEFEVIQ
jgi:beta-glucosidase